MIKSKAAFVVYGVHKDGLCDPDGNLFIDEGLIKNSKEALKNQGIELVTPELIVATKKEAKERTLNLLSGNVMYASHNKCKVSLEFA